jgi:hypothetical protein
MSTDSVNTARQSRAKWSCCLVGLGAIVFVVVLVLALACGLHWLSDKEIREQWERKVADLEAGRTTCLIQPEPRFLEDFVTKRPEAAAKVIEVQMYIGRASDKRFRYVGQFPKLEKIYLYEIWEGADTFLKNIAGMKSLTSLSLSKTRLSGEGFAAVASFPNLKRLQFDWACKGADLKPLSGHKNLETLVLHGVPIIKE